MVMGIMNFTVQDNYMATIKLSTQDIPSFLFINSKGEPMMQPGAFPKHVFKKIIEEYLLTIEMDQA
jgi:hypothetical protein